MIEVPANVTGVQDLFADLVGGTLATNMPAKVPVKAESNVAQPVVVQ